MICPKCGFSQPEDIYCASCGVNIERYVRKRKKRRYLAWMVGIFFGLTALILVRYLDTHQRAKETELRKETLYSSTDRVQVEENRRSFSKEPETKRAVPSRAAEGPRTRVARHPPEPSRPGPAGADGSKGTAGSSPPAAEEKTPATAADWFEKGRELDDDSELEAEAYRKAIELDSEFAPAYYHLGAMLYRRANYDLAEKQFARFLRHASAEEREEYSLYLFYSEAEIERMRESQEPEPLQAEGEETGARAAGEQRQEPAEETSPGVQTIVRFSSEKGRIVVPALLNGTTRARLLLDTGAEITVVSRDLGLRLGLEPTAASKVRLKTIGTEIEAPLARLDSLRIGNLQRDNLTVAVTDLDLGDGEIQGILGMDLLNSYTIHIDNKRGRVLLRPR